MLSLITHTASLAKGPIARNLPAVATSGSFRFCSVDPICRYEAPQIETNKDIKNSEKFSAATIVVPTQVDLTPINGIPEEHIKTRRVRIYQPSKNAMQSGTNNIQHWMMEFDNRQRWENPLMGWTSTGDPLSNMKVAFQSSDDAIEHCEKNGWTWYLDVPKLEKEERPKNYGINFSWDKRTRVSTK